MDDLDLKILGFVKSGFKAKAAEAFKHNVMDDLVNKGLSTEHANWIYIPFSRCIIGFDFDKGIYWIASGKINTPVIEYTEFNKLEEIGMYKDDRPVYSMNTSECEGNYKSVLEAFLYSVKEGLQDLKLKLKLQDGADKDIVFFHNRRKLKAIGVESWLSPLNLSEGLEVKISIIQSNDNKNIMLDNAYIPAINCCLLLTKVLECRNKHVPN